MKTLLEKSTYENTIKRINQLLPGSERRWGSMTAGQMLCHVSDGLRDILGVRPMKPMLPPEMQQHLKAVVFGENDWEHGLQTFPPYSQDEGGLGTKPTNFEQDRKALVDLLNQFHNTPVDFTFHPHAGLDILPREEFGMFFWRHIDYHLRQFGV